MAIRGLFGRLFVRVAHNTDVPDKMQYRCDSCDITINGLTTDIQEAPLLECPECEDKMEISHER
jgi:DNA-directed RNA polymerase subunit RPC12/RpoP